VIGNETGEWSIPVGGMGAVSGSMAKRARELGAELKANCEVLAISDNRVVTYLEAGQSKTLHARYILANVSQPVLNSMLGKPTEHNIEGAQVKVNMLLKRLPKLKAGTDPVAAFGGTFHINESFEQLQTAFEQAENGEIPNPLPCEIYCHSLTDPSILGPELQESGAQTLTVFALHTPHSLLKGRNHDEMRAALELAAINSINSVLAEDIRDLLLTDEDGNPCLETKTTQDLEDALGLPGGNIFHAPLSWPYAENDEPLQTPAQQWGVDTGEPGILFCGSTAKRGGAVSGIAGHNAAMAVLKLEEERLAH
jgi:phytoene dehydrogenase-like protein